MKGLFIILLFVSCYTQAQLTTMNARRYKGVVTYVAPAADSMFINMDTTQTEPTAVNWTGDPTKHGTSWSITGGVHGTITATLSSANYNPYGVCGCSASPNNGYTSSTIFTAQARKECWFSYNGGVSNLDAYDPAKPKLVISGLNPTSTYTIEVGGTLDGATFNFNSITDYRVSGLTTPALKTINCKSNISTTQTFTVQPDASGNIKIYFNAESGQDMSVNSAIKIKG
jgi:hypothetical protein